MEWQRQRHGFYEVLEGRMRFLIGAVPDLLIRGSFWVFFGFRPDGLPPRAGRVIATVAAEVYSRLPRFNTFRHVSTRFFCCFEIFFGVFFGFLVFNCCGDSSSASTLVSVKNATPQAPQHSIHTWRTKENPVILGKTQ